MTTGPPLEFRQNTRSFCAENVPLVPHDPTWIPNLDKASCERFEAWAEQMNGDVDVAGYDYVEVSVRHLVSLMFGGELPPRVDLRHLCISLVETVHRAAPTILLWCTEDKATGMLTWTDARKRALGYLGHQPLLHEFGEQQCTIDLADAKAKALDDSRLVLAASMVPRGAAGADSYVFASTHLMKTCAAMLSARVEEYKKQIAKSTEPTKKTKKKASRRASFPQIKDDASLESIAEAPRARIALTGDRAVPSDDDTSVSMYTLPDWSRGANVFVERFFAFYAYCAHMTKAAPDGQSYTVCVDQKLRDAYKIDADAGTDLSADFDAPWNDARRAWLAEFLDLAAFALASGNTVKLRCVASGGDGQVSAKFTGKKGGDVALAAGRLLAGYGAGCITRLRLVLVTTTSERWRSSADTMGGYLDTHAPRFGSIAPRPMLLTEIGYCCGNDDAVRWGDAETAVCFGAPNAAATRPQAPSTAARTAAHANNANKNKNK